MIGWIKKHKWCLILFFVIFVLAIPLAINIAFQYISPLEFLRAEWGAGDALGFYGSLISAGIAVYGVFLSIQYAQKNYREDVKNRVLPYFAVTHYKSKSKRDLFSPVDLSEDSERDEHNFYKEYKIEKAYFIIKDDEILVKDGLTKEQENLLKQGGFEWKKASNAMSLIDHPLVSCPLEVENVGNGAAINFRVGFNRSDGKRVYLTPQPLKLNATFYVHIFADTITDKIKGKYVLEFYYDDIFGTQYCQKYDFEIETDDDTGRLYHSIDFSGKQVVVKEENKWIR